MTEISLAAIQSTLARKSLAHFVRKSWHVLEPATPLVWGWHMQAVCDAVQALLENRIPENNLVINVPPGSAKSRIVSVCAPAWHWIDHPHWRGIFASGNPRVTTRDSLYTRTLITSRWYIESFRPTWRLAGDQNVKTLYYTDAGGYRMAVSTGQKITGDRGDALFWDDPIDAAENTAAARAACITWYDQAFANRLSDLQTGKRCGIAQRLHEGDLTGHVLKGGAYAQLSIPQEYFPPLERQPDGSEVEVKPRVWANGFVDPRSAEGFAKEKGPKGGLLMDEKRFPKKVLDAEKLRLGSAGYDGQHQQNPTATEGEIFKRVYWGYFKACRYLPGSHVGTPMSRDELVAHYGITHFVAGCDTALTAKKTADSTSIHIFGVTPKRFLVVDHWKGQVESPEAKKTLALYSAKWGVVAVAVEGGNVAAGKAIAQELRRDTALPIVEIPALIDKIAAAKLVLPTVEAGVVFLPEDLPWCADFVDSMAGFPRLVHDDDVDSFRIGLQHIITGTAAAALFEYLRGASATQSQGAA